MAAGFCWKNLAFARKIMVLLESVGWLQQPHTRAKLLFFGQQLNSPLACTPMLNAVSILSTCVVWLTRGTAALRLWASCLRLARSRWYPLRSVAGVSSRLSITWRCRSCCCCCVSQISERLVNSQSLTISWTHYTDRHKNVNADIALHGNPISELRDVTCHMGLHSVTCHPTQVNTPRLTPAMQADTRFTYPRGTEGWVDLADLIVPRPGVEPATFRSRVRRRTTAQPRHPIQTDRHIQHGCIPFQI